MKLIESPSKLIIMCHVFILPLRHCRQSPGENKITLNIQFKERKFLRWKIKPSMPAPVTKGFILSYSGDFWVFLHQGLLFKRCHRKLDLSFSRFKNKNPLVW